MTLTSSERSPARDRAPRDTTVLIGQVPDPARRFFAAAWARRGRIMAFVLTAAAISAGIAMLLPRWYRAETTILPPTENSSDSFGLMSALVENTALAKLGLFSSTTPSDIYVEILKSRTLREPLIRDFDLEHRYDTKGTERTLKELGQHIAIESSPTGIVTIHVEDRDPQRAAAMANELVDGLDRFNRESVNTRAKRTRQFLEARLIESRARMTEAESLLTAYEQKNKVVASTGAAIGPMADVISQKLSLEVRRSYMASYTRPGNPGLREVDAEIEAMNSELGKLPRLKQAGSRLALDAEIQRRVFSLLTAQYEDMRVQETRDTPTLSVLDSARTPEVRSRPKRGFIVIGTTLVALMLSAAWVAMTLRTPVRV